MIVTPPLLALFRPAFHSGRAVSLLVLGRLPLHDAGEVGCVPVALRSSGERRRRGTRCAIWRARIHVRPIFERDRLQPTINCAWYRVTAIGQREGTAAHVPARLVAVVHRARRLIRARARCEVRTYVAGNILLHPLDSSPGRDGIARPILVSRVAIPSRSLDSALESSREPCATSAREMPRSTESTRGVRRSRV